MFFMPLSLTALIGGGGGAADLTGQNYRALLLTESVH